MENSVSDRQGATTWHLCWQAAMGRNLVSSPKLLEKITDRLTQAHRQRGRALLYYLLMPREIHVLARIPAGDAPRAVAREVATIVARWVREFQRERGPVFAERYRTHEIRTDAELKYEVRMLAWRPVAMGLCTAPRNHVSSSLRTTLGLRRAYGFESRPLLGVFGGTVFEARNELGRLIRQRPSDAELREWELNHGLALAVGSAGPTFGMAREVEGPAAALVAAASPQDIDGALSLLERWVAHRLALESGEDLSTLPGAVGAQARALVAGLAVQAGLCPAASVARHFNRARATLCEQMTASRSREVDRQMLGTPMQLILDEIKRLKVVGSKGF
ncbi:hypothetical protein [Roseateles sp. LYH14W]|uniref:Transposase IS200-like domain-containing protein n=1 Tax=Pelomonas parva TaxID=3299032 RepID=A0ABW7F8B4_9BURK